jgi:hypothetical protein
MRGEDFWKQSSEEEEACESRSCMSTYFLVQTHHHPIQLQEALLALGRDCVLL